MASNAQPNQPRALDEAPTRAFRLERFGDLELHAPRWLVRGTLEADCMAVAFGDPGTGKSFIGIDIGACVATGMPWHGYRTQTAAVAYIAGEGRNGLARRRRAWEIRHGIDLAEHPFYVSNRAAALTDEIGALEVRNAAAEIAAEQGAPGLIIVDTLARNFGPADENSTADMNAFVAALDALRADYGATVLVIHHTGHGDKSRSRGSMVLKAAIDAEYRLDKDESGVVRMEATKMKDAKAPEPIAFRINTVELGFSDDEGEPVTSAILDRVDYTAAPKPAKAGRGKHQTTALEVLKRLHREHRERLAHDGRDPDTARVELRTWRQAMREAGVPRSSSYELPNSLHDAGLARVERGFAWPA